jgi:hypothetical protein
MSFDVQAARDRQVTLACGYCANTPTLDRLGFHPALKVAIPDNPARPRGRGVRRVEHKGYQAAGTVWDTIDAAGNIDEERSFRERMVERGAEDGVLTYWCAAGHEHPLPHRRLFKASMAAMAAGRRKLLAGVDV